MRLLRFSPTKKDLHTTNIILFIIVDPMSTKSVLIYLFQAGGQRGGPAFCLPSSSTLNTKRPQNEWAGTKYINRDPLCTSVVFALTIEHIWNHRFSTWESLYLGLPKHYCYKQKPCSHLTVRFLLKLKCVFIMTWSFCLWWFYLPAHCLCLWL